MFLPGEPVCSLHCFCQGRQFAHYTVYAVGEGGGRGRVYSVHLTWLFALHFVCQGRQFAGYTVFARGDNSSLTLFLPGAPLYSLHCLCPRGRGWRRVGEFALYIWCGSLLCTCFCQERQFARYTVFARGANSPLTLFLPGAPVSLAHCFCQGRQHPAKCSRLRTKEASYAFVVIFLFFTSRLNLLTQYPTPKHC